MQPLWVRIGSTAVAVAALVTVGFRTPPVALPLALAALCTAALIAAAFHRPSSLTQALREIQITLVVVAACHASLFGLVVTEGPLLTTVLLACYLGVTLGTACVLVIRSRKRYSQVPTIDDSAPHDEAGTAEGGEVEPGTAGDAPQSPGDNAGPLDSEVPTPSDTPGLMDAPRDAQTSGELRIHVLPALVRELGVPVRVVAG